MQLLLEQVGGDLRRVLGFCMNVPGHQDSLLKQALSHVNKRNKSWLHKNKDNQKVSKAIVGLAENKKKNKESKRVQKEIAKKQAQEVREQRERKKAGERERNERLREERERRQPEEAEGDAQEVSSDE